MPIIPFLIIAAIIYSVVSNAKKEQARQQQQQRKAQSLFGAPTADTEAARQDAERRKLREQSAAPSSMESEMQRAARQAELKRRLQENAARREAERSTRPANLGTPANSTERRPLEKRVMENALRREKPIAAHSEDDCGGGSIHDGYHEGVTQFGSGRPAAVAGRLGHDLADEDDRLVKEAAAAENARRAMERISKLPPLAQGMVYAEILGKPKSEIA